MSLLLLLQSAAAGNVTAEPTAGSLTLTGATPTVRARARVPIWVSPADAAGMTATPVLVFTMPALGSAMHFNMQLDTTAAFNTGDLRDLSTYTSQTGWEYWDGAAWTGFPAAGVSSTYGGNDARYTVVVRPEQHDLAPARAGRDYLDGCRVSRGWSMGERRYRSDRRRGRRGPCRAGHGRPDAAGRVLEGLRHHGAGVRLDRAVRTRRRHDEHGQRPWLDEGRRLVQGRDVRHRVRPDA